MISNPLRLLAVLATLVLAVACGDDGGGAGDDDDDGPLSVSFEIPSEGTVLLAAEETLPMQVSTTGSPDRVALFVDEVDSENFTADGLLTWNPASFAAGSHTLVAVAFRNEDDPENVEMAMSGSITATIDRDAPVIVDRFPASGSTDFDLRDPIEVTLDEPVFADNAADGIDVSASPVVCPSPPCDGRPLDLDVTLSKDGTSILALLDEVPGSAELPVDLSVRVGLPLSDPAGNPIEMGMNWTFQVPPWLPFEGGDAILGTNLDSITRGPKMVYSPGGTPFVLWAGEAPGGGDNEARLFRYRDFWELQNDTNDLTGITFRDVALAVDLSGAAWIAVGGTAEEEAPVVNVRQFNGAMFLDRGAPDGLDGTGDPGIEVVDVELAIAPRAGAQLVLVVTADYPTEGGEERRITAYQFTGLDWVQLGDDVIVDDVAEGRVVIDNANRPVVAYRIAGAFAGEFNVEMKRWENPDWVPLSVSIPHTGDDFGFAIDDTDRFFIAVKAGLQIVPWQFTPGSIAAELPGRNLVGQSATIGIDQDGRVTIATEDDILRWFRQGGDPRILIAVPFGVPDLSDVPEAAPDAAVAVSPDGTVIRANIEDTGTIWQLSTTRFNERPLEGE